MQDIFDKTVKKNHVALVILSILDKKKKIGVDKNVNFLIHEAKVKKLLSPASPMIRITTPCGHFPNPWGQDKEILTHDKDNNTMMPIS